MPLDADFKLDEAAQKLADEAANQVLVFQLGRRKLLIMLNFQSFKNLINLIDKKTPL